VVGAGTTTTGTGGGGREAGGAGEASAAEGRAQDCEHRDLWKRRKNIESFTHLVHQLLDQQQRDRLLLRPS